MTREQIERMRKLRKFDHPWLPAEEEALLAAAERALLLEDKMRNIRKAVSGYLAQLISADQLRAAIDRAEGK